VVPGAVVAVGGVAWIGVLVARQGLKALPDLGSPVVLWTQVPKQMTGTLESAAWMAAALGVSLLSWLLARRMVGRSGLL
jgi:hypothetical protein